jgi:hypothetical protein
MKSNSKENFSRVDVSQPGYARLVKENFLDGTPRAGQRAL